MRRLHVCLACAVASVCLAACSDSSGPETRAPVVAGTVLDAEGNPVADAAVVLDLDFVEERARAADKPQTAISFTLSEPGRVDLRITDACNDEVFYAQDDSLPAGQYQIVWDGTDSEGLLVIEGFCQARIRFDGHEPFVHQFALARNLGDETGEFATVACATVRDTWRVDAWTDEDGRFTIARRCWDFGRTITGTDETGAATARLVVANRVRVWAYPADGTTGTASAWFEAGGSTPAEVPVRLAPPGS